MFGVILTTGRGWVSPVQPRPEAERLDVNVDAGRFGGVGQPTTNSNRRVTLAQRMRQTISECLYQNSTVSANIYVDLNVNCRISLDSALGDWTQSTIGSHLAVIRSWLAPLVLISTRERCHVERIAVPVV